MVHSPISTLLYFVDHTNLLTIWSALLLECKVQPRRLHHAMQRTRSRLTRSKVMVVSSKVERLTPVLEGLRCLLFPLQWPHVYISNLFLALADFINAPMPFLIGVLRHVFTDLDVPDDVMIVDIDVDEVRFCSPKPPPFPQQHLDFLSNALQVNPASQPHSFVPLHAAVCLFIHSVCCRHTPTSSAWTTPPPPITSYPRRPASACSTPTALPPPSSKTLLL